MRATSIRSGVLTGRQIRALRLIADAPDLDAQIQPNGVDLTVGFIERIVGSGFIARDNANRLLPATDPLTFPHYDTRSSHPGTQPLDTEALDVVWLGPGNCFVVRFNETVNLPIDMMAFLRPRSSLLRCGVALHTAVWDAGYHGKGQSLITVTNNHGVWIEQDARIAQMTFLTLSEAALQGYDGAYQHEGLG